MSSFNQDYYERYHEQIWPEYKEILESSGLHLRTKNVVGKNGWTDFNDWMFGDGIWLNSHSQENRDLKACGRYGGTIKITQIINDSVKVKYFDFFDLQRRCVYVLEAKKLKELYSEGKFTQEYIEHKVDDKKNGLARFDTSDIIQNAKKILKK